MPGLLSGGPCGYGILRPGTPGGKPRGNHEHHSVPVLDVGTATV
jgi:hypothetical protein